MTFLHRIQQVGITSETSLEVAKRIRIVNSMTMITIFLGLVILAYSVLMQWPPSTIGLFVFFMCSTTVPLLLNHKGYTLASRMYYLITSYIIILFLPILTGPSLHYQYFLIGGIGMPFLFLGNEIGKVKWFLSGIAIVLWAYLEWHFTKFQPIIAIDEMLITPVRLVNDLMIFITVFSIIAIFIRENQNHVSELERKSQELLESNEQLQQFSHTVSHDLKAPLTNISSLAQMAQTKFGDEISADLMLFLGHIQENALRSSKLISSILAYSKAGVTDTETSTFQLSELLSKVCSFIQVPNGFEVIYEHALPEVRGSVVQLEQVIMNLVSNAIKYHDKDSGTIRIDIEQDDHHFIAISVIDDGPGIPEKYHQRIFNIFESAHETKRDDSTGIGLAIVRKLVQLNGGKIELHSKMGSGSTFRFTWPLDNDTQH